MKRYWLSALLGVFVVAAIGTYYVYGTMERLPDYKLNTIEGNPQEMDKVEINGWYGGVLHSDFLHMNTVGTTYKKDYSLYETNVKNARSWLYGQEEFQDLKNKHRNFMRGKISMDGFYKDEDWLIYADTRLDYSPDNIQEAVLKMDFLNEKTRKVTHYRTSIMQSSDYNYISIGDVQRIGDQVHILVSSQSNNNYEFHVYTVDLTNGTIIRNDTLYQVEAEEKDHFNLSVISNEIRSEPGEYAVLRIRKEKWNQEGSGSYRVELKSENLISYSYLTGKLTDLPLERDQGDIKRDSASYILNGSTLSSFRTDTTAILVSRFDVANNQKLSGVSEVSTGQFDVDEMVMGSVRRDKVYVLLRKANNQYVAVVDATSGKVLYKGQAVSDGPASKVEDHMKNLHLMYINLK
ncbi:hypothetical protein [Cohnella mopanensis]|uniref:hypothetical protein n=1 Tax=Cohnella mopanensis TaxID=2911966 RepID=UPI001EF8152A|nr:hypothetical protein [Cohnella mopanensis]